MSVIQVILYLPLLLQDDKDMFDYNVDERVQAFIKACNDQVL